MSIGKAFVIFFKLPGRMADILAAAAVLAFMAPALYFAGVRARAAKDRKKYFLMLSSASSIEENLKKFGSLDFLKEYDVDLGVFDKTVLLWCPVRYNGSLETGDLIIYERSAFLGVFRWATHVFHAFRTAIKHSRDLRLIRAFSPFNQGVMAWLISRILKIPFFVSIHADYDVRFKISGAGHSNVLAGSRSAGKMTESFVLHRADFILSQFDMHTRYISQYNIDPAKIRFIRHGIDLSIFRSPPRHELFGAWFSGKDRIVSFAGRVSSDNYIFDVCRVAETVLKARDGVKFFIAGDGPQAAEVKERLAEHIKQGKVIMSGFISLEMSQELRKCSAVNLCLMAGYSLLEAAASGKPVVAYDIEWHPELIRNGETGFLADEHDTDKVAEYINLLLDNKELAEDIGKKAKEAVFLEHDLRRHIEAKASCYREAISAKEK